MSKEALKRLRIIVPGLIIFLVILPLIFEVNELSMFIKKEPIPVLLFNPLSILIIWVVLGSLYHITNTRGVFFKEPLGKIQFNIKKGFRVMFGGNPVISKKIEKFEWKTLRHLFYFFIDKDSTLSEKAKNVYSNGLFLSSMADLEGISYFGFIFYLIAFRFVKSPLYFITSLVLIILFFLARYLLLPKFTRKHIDLSNEQIEFIKIHYLSELQEKIIEINLE